MIVAVITHLYFFHFWSIEIRSIIEPFTYTLFTTVSGQAAKMLKFLAFSLIFTTVSAEVGADLAEAFLDVDIAEESDAEDTSTASCSNALWGQCGGEGWTGSTCCPAGSTCTFDNQWCVPFALFFALKFHRISHRTFR